VLAYFATEIRFRTIGKTEIAILFALIFMTGVALVNVPEFAINRIVGTNLKTDTSTAGRYSLFHKGFSLFLKNPLLGVGLYNSANHGPFKGTDMHDTFAVAFGETGLLGTIALLTIIIVTIIKQGRMIKELRASGDDFLLRTALITRAAFVAILVSSFGNIIIYRRIFWIYIALTNVLSQADLYRLYQREKVE
jgi:O-antigen ligase